MKGLKEYIKKHGEHFTVELAYDAALSRRWDRKQIEDAIKRKVWYNVTGSTIGDIVYLVNDCYDDASSFGFDRKDKCINYTLSYIGDYKNYGGELFKYWLSIMSKVKVFKDSFDFTPYI